MKEFEEILGSGFDISIHTQVKRIDGEFVPKVCWKIGYNRGSGKAKCESRWEGFDTPGEAISDMIEASRKLILDQRILSSK